MIYILLLILYWSLLMYLEWLDNYNSGLPEIDVQHQRFLHLIKKLYLENDDKKEIFILNEIYRYAVFHFVSEEELMLVYSYSEIEKQKQSHQDILLELSSIVNPFQEFHFNKEKVLYFLMNWFVDHTTIEDKDLGRFINTVRSA